MIKRYTQQIILVCTSVLLVACNRDDNGLVTEDGKIDMTKAIDFKVNFSDFNDEEETTITRTNSDLQPGDTLSQQVVELDNNLLAIVTVQKDTAKSIMPKIPTRVLEDGNYRLTAVPQGAMYSYIGPIKGFVHNGSFMHADNETLELIPGTYRFCLVNDKANYKIDTTFPWQPYHLIVMNPEDIPSALVGAVNNVVITPTPKHQQVKFEMKHPGARMRIKLTSFMPHTAISGKIEGAIRTEGTFDVAFSSITNGTSNPIAWSNNCTFPASEYTFPTPGKMDNICTSISNEYQYFFTNNTLSDLKLVLNNGTLYRKDLSTNPLTIKFATPTPVQMQVNGSYLINVKLMYNFWYLMSDGSVGLTKETTYAGGTKTPIALVLSRSKQIAMGLKNANGNQETAYGIVPWQRDNDVIYSMSSNEALEDMAGYHYTWDASGSYDGVTIKGNEKTKYPAFYYAGHYGSEIEADLTAKGISLDNDLKNKKWYLPSSGELNYITKLGFGNTSGQQLGVPVPTYMNFVDVAFAQVGGTRLRSKGLWSSVETVPNLEGLTIQNFYYDNTFNGFIDFGDYAKSVPFYVRAFIKY